MDRKRERKRSDNDSFDCNHGYLLNNRGRAVTIVGRAFITSIRDILQRQYIILY